MRHRLKGRLEHRLCDRLRARLLEVPQSRELVLDLQDVVELDMSTLATLVALAYDLQKHGRSLRLLCPPGCVAQSVGLLCAPFPLKWTVVQPEEATGRVARAPHSGTTARLPSGTDLRHTVPLAGALR